jgi:MFS family permease
MPGWIWPFLAILAAQTAVSFLTRVIPTLAPVLTQETGLTAAGLGHVQALGSLGSILFLVVGAPLIRRAGPIRSLQIGMAAAAFGVASLSLETALAVAAASLLIGVGYGPSPPAGSEVLHKNAPPRHRTLIFSIKQAGVPLGGVIAGLALPPLATGMDWRLSLVFCVVLAIATIILMQGVREATDAGRDRAQALGAEAFLSRDNVTRPLRALAAVPLLTRLAYAGACYAVGQGVWFAFLVIFLVVALGHDLATAGKVFATMQASGIVGRILLGWVSDRIGSGLVTLAVIGVVSAATSTALAFATPDWPLAWLYLLAGVAGVTVSSWNGVHLAEIAHFARPGTVGDTTAGGTLVTFIGYVVGPSGIGLVLAFTGSWQAAFFATAAVSLSATLVLVGLVRQVRRAG